MSIADNADVEAAQTLGKLDATPTEELAAGVVRLALQWAKDNPFDQQAIALRKSLADLDAAAQAMTPDDLAAVQAEAGRIAAITDSVTRMLAGTRSFGTKWRQIVEALQ